MTQPSWDNTETCMKQIIDEITHVLTGVKYTNEGVPRTDMEMNNIVHTADKEWDIYDHYTRPTYIEDEEDEDYGDEIELPEEVRLKNALVEQIDRCIYVDGPFVLFMTYGFGFSLEKIHGLLADLSVINRRPLDIHHSETTIDNNQSCINWGFVDHGDNTWDFFILLHNDNDSLKIDDEEWIQGMCDSDVVSHIKSLIY